MTEHIERELRRVIAELTRDAATSLGHERERERAHACGVVYALREIEKVIGRGPIPEPKETT